MSSRRARRVAQRLREQLGRPIPDRIVSIDYVWDGSKLPGRCSACGATRTFRDLPDGKVWSQIAHAGDCPAIEGPEWTPAA